MFGVTVKTEPDEKDGSTVRVKYRRQSIRWLTKQLTVLTDAQIEAIYKQARRSKPGCDARSQQACSETKEVGHI
jgi:hypothetical protein